MFSFLTRILPEIAMISPAHATLIQELEKYYPPISTGFKVKVVTKTFEVTYKRNSRILNYKQVQDSGLFIYKGSAVELSVNQTTLAETAIRFWFEKDFPFTTPGLFNREPSLSGIKLMQDTTFLVLPFDDYLALKIEFPEVEILTEKMRAHYDKLRHEYEEEFSLKASHRVKKLEQEHPDIYNLAEIQHIAQYHKISMETLRRLRGK